MRLYRQLEIQPRKRCTGSAQGGFDLSNRHEQLRKARLTLCARRRDEIAEGDHLGLRSLEPLDDERPRPALGQHGRQSHGELIERRRQPLPLHALGMRRHWTKRNADRTGYDDDSSQSPTFPPHRFPPSPIMARPQQHTAERKLRPPISQQRNRIVRYCFPPRWRPAQLERCNESGCVRWPPDLSSCALVDQIDGRRRLYVERERLPLVPDGMAPATTPRLSAAGSAPARRRAGRRPQP